MAIFLSYGPRVPLSLSRTHDNRTLYAVEVAGGGRSSAISRKMSAKRIYSRTRQRQSEWSRRAWLHDRRRALRRASILRPDEEECDQAAVAQRLALDAVRDLASRILDVANGFTGRAGGLLSLALGDELVVASEFFRPPP